MLPLDILMDTLKNNSSLSSLIYYCLLVKTKRAKIFFQLEKIDKEYKLQNMFFCQLNNEKQQHRIKLKEHKSPFS